MHFARTGRSIYNFCPKVGTEGIIVHKKKVGVKFIGGELFFRIIGALKIPSVELGDLDLYEHLNANYLLNHLIFYFELWIS